MTGEPLKLADDEDMAAYAELTGSPIGMLRLAQRCPKCEAPILACDNGVWLDARPTDVDGPLVMGVMQMGTFAMACSVDPGQPGSHHALHDHQPEEN